MKLSFLVLINFILLFSGCTSLSEEEVKKECRDAGKKYIITDKFNFRTGKVEKQIKCLNLS